MLANDFPISGMGVFNEKDIINNFWTLKNAQMAVLRYGHYEDIPISRPWPLGQSEVGEALGFLVQKLFIQGIFPLAALRIRGFLVVSLFPSSS